MGVGIQFRGVRVAQARQALVEVTGPRITMMGYSYERQPTHEQSCKFKVVEKVKQVLVVPQDPEKM